MTQITHVLHPDLNRQCDRRQLGLRFLMLCTPTGISLWYTLPVELRSYIIRYTLSELPTLLDESEDYDNLKNKEHIWLFCHVRHLCMLSFEWAYEIRRIRWAEA